MTKAARTFHRWISEMIARYFLVKPHLQILLLHRIYPQISDVNVKNGSCSEGITMQYLDEAVSWFKKRGYIFITPSELVADNLSEKQNYIMLTFDDGYFNNYLALEILERHQVKATFYISTNHIEQNKSFWWDVLYRERGLQGVDDETVTKELMEIMDLSWEDIENHMIRTFGENAMVPLNDLDRPMSIEELKKFAEHPLVEIGNHTHNHLKLINYTRAEIQHSIAETQQKLVSWIGYEPVSISYPYGYYNNEVLDVTSEMGFKAGITVNEGSLNLSELMQSGNYLTLKRSHFVGWIPVEDQCYNIYSGFSLMKWFTGGFR